MVALIITTIAVTIIAIPMNSAVSDMLDGEKSLWRLFLIIRKNKSNRSIKNPKAISANDVLNQDKYVRSLAAKSLKLLIILQW